MGLRKYFVCPFPTTEKRRESWKKNENFFFLAHRFSASLHAAVKYSAYVYFEKGFYIDVSLVDNVITLCGCGMAVTASKQLAPVPIVNCARVGARVLVDFRLHNFTQFSTLFV